MELADILAGCLQVGILGPKLSLTRGLRLARRGVGLLWGVAIILFCFRRLLVVQEVPSKQCVGNICLVQRCWRIIVRLLWILLAVKVYYS